VRVSLYNLHDDPMSLYRSGDLHIRQIHLVEDEDFPEHGVRYCRGPKAILEILTFVYGREFHIKIPRTQKADPDYQFALRVIASHGTLNADTDVIMCWSGHLSPAELKAAGIVVTPPKKKRLQHK
jgi:hypothetical protein